jgi:selenocysteine lyase/cysteine desulfurase
LARHEFRGQEHSFFDSAAIGLESKQAEAAAKTRRELDWPQLVEQSLRSVARLFEDSPTNITFFHNTTAGVQRVFLRLSHLQGARLPTLLTTDTEYPGIMAMVDENWNGRVVVAKIAESINRGRAGEVADRLVESVLASRPSVVYLSHIGRANGYRLDETVLSKIKELDPRILLIIDGAQACGNIFIKQELLDLVDFYVTSGHKWLCGKHTLGIVRAHNHWRLKDPSQSYSRTSTASGTGNRAVLLSFNKAIEDLNGEIEDNQTAEQRLRAIEDHNKGLARAFSAKINERWQIRSLGEMNGDAWQWNGIVAVRLPSQRILDELCELSKRRRVKFTVLKSEDWRDDVGGESLGPRYSLDPSAFEPDRFFKDLHLRGKPIHGTGPAWVRFCFHYFHAESDVDGLIEMIGSAIQSAQKN